MEKGEMWKKPEIRHLQLRAVKCKEEINVILQFIPSPVQIGQLHTHRHTQTRAQTHSPA